VAPDRAALASRASVVPGRQTAVCFFAIAYAYWEFFARDPDLVVAAGEAAVARGLLAEPAVLAESPGL
jgi:hypothetical protein